MYKKPSLIVSTCGISLATNILKHQKHNAKYPEKFAPYNYANRIALDACTDKASLHLLAEDCLLTLPEESITVQRKLSAELNALWHYYQGQPSQHADDIHFLLHTDTWLGKVIAQAIQEAMERQGLTVSLFRIDELRTSSLENFRNGTGELIAFLEKNIPGYKETHHIVFNLSGGFKSIQGVMQTLASIYADEVIYIFETSEELLRIPRLPLQLDWDTIKNSLNVLRRLALQLPVEESLLKQTPQVMLYQSLGEYDISEWGKLLLERSKTVLYARELLESPSNKIYFTDSFKKSIANLEADRLRQVNERIDDLARFMEIGDNPRRLRFHNLEGKPYLGSTHEFYAFSDDAKRVYCHYDNALLVLDALDKHL